MDLGIDYDKDSFLCYSASVFVCANVPFGSSVGLCLRLHIACNVCHDVTFRLAKRRGVIYPGLRTGGMLLDGDVLSTNPTPPSSTIASRKVAAPYKGIRSITILLVKCEGGMPACEACPVTES